MTKDKEPILQFERSKQDVMDYFGCEGDFFVKPQLELEWAVWQDEDFTFLCYWTEDGKKIDAVVVKKGVHDGGRDRLCENRLYFLQQQKPDEVLRKGQWPVEETEKAAQTRLLKPFFLHRLLY